MDNSISMSFNIVLGHYDMLSEHFHLGYEIYYLADGERTFFIKDRIVQVCKGMLVIINSNELHKTTDAGKSDYKRFVINFREKFLLSQNESINVYLNDFFNRINKQHYFILQLKASEQMYIENLFYNMLDEIKCKSNGLEAFLHSFLMQMIIWTNRYLEDYSTPDFHHLSLKHQKVLEIVQYINNHYSEPISISFISKHYYISSFYLSRIFKEATGFTFLEYLTSIRIKEAQKLLTDSELKVSIISDIVGIGSISQFNRVFRRITGMSPMEYRNQNDIKEK